jgi:hypothetical protein
VKIDIGRPPGSRVDLTLAHDAARAVQRFAAALECAHERPAEIPIHFAELLAAPVSALSSSIGSPIVERCRSGDPARLSAIGAPLVMSRARLTLAGAD